MCVKLLLIYYYSYDSTSKSREQQFITKVCIATHTTLNFKIKPALYFSILQIKLFKTITKLF